MYKGYAHVSSLDIVLANRILLPKLLDTLVPSVACWKLQPTRYVMTVGALRIP